MSRNEEQSYTLTLTKAQIQHLRWVLECEAELQQQLMDSPEEGQAVEQQLEDWTICRDMKVRAMALTQLIDRVMKPKKSRSKC